ncbi:MAG: hypothetical protein ACR2PL_16020 [Dehalococcoidia bacterium]
MTRFASAIRVQLICPCGNARQYRAAAIVIASLLDEKSIQEWGGFTHSQHRNPVFTGQFWDTERVSNGQPGSWAEDRNLLIFIDAPN